MSKAKKEAALQELEVAKQKYKDANITLNNSYDRLFARKDSAKKIIKEVEQLINSIKNKPFHFCVKELRVIKKNMKTYVSKEDLLRKEKRKNIGGAIAAAGVLGVGSVAAFGLKDFLAAAFSEKKIKTKVILACVFLALFIIVLAVYLIWKGINRISTARSAIAETKKIVKDTYQVDLETHKVNDLSEKIEKLESLIGQMMDELRHFSKINYRQLPDGDRDELGSLVNNTLALSELMNTHF